MSYKLQIASIVSALVAVALTVLVALNYVFSVVGSIVRDAYASDWTSEFLIAHLQSNDDSWPSSWDDLEDEHAAKHPQPCPFTFAEIRDRVELSFDVESTAIANARVPFTFFRLKSGRATNYEGDPNIRVRDYLVNPSKQHDAKTE